MVISADLGLEKHISNVSTTCFCHLRQLRHVRRSRTTESATTLVTSQRNYCNVIFIGGQKPVTNKLQRLLKRQPECSVARGSSTVVWHSSYMPTFTDLTCISASSTNSAWWCADARTALLHSIWRCTGHQSPRLHRDITFVRLLVINWQCHHISRSHPSLFVSLYLRNTSSFLSGTCSIRMILVWLAGLPKASSRAVHTCWLPDISRAVETAGRGCCCDRGNQETWFRWIRDTVRVSSGQFLQLLNTFMLEAAVADWLSRWGPRLRSARVVWH